MTSPSHSQETRHADPNSGAAGACAGYRLLRKLGEGAGGVVWEAEAPDGGRLALKILPTALAGQASAVAALRRELATAQRLDHPSLIRILRFIEPEDDAPCIEMELVTGRSLAQLAADQPQGILTWEELAPIANQLCAALSHAHQRGVIHRDIKPSNILVTTDGTVKLADFGCASVIDAWVTHMTADHVLPAAGTLAFMSPQQIHALPPSNADDIYTVGATLYTLLCGCPPFQRGRFHAGGLNSAALPLDRRQRVLGIDNPVPPTVIRAIQRCLHHDPSRRPASADALAAELALPPDGARSRRRFVAALAAGGLTATFATAAVFRAISPAKRSIENGFIPIFDGKSLAGWSGDPACWQAVDETIRGQLEGPRTHDASAWRKEDLTYLANDLADFELRMEVMLVIPEPDAGNLGVVYRKDPQRPTKPAYELDLEPNWKRNCGLREFGGRDTLARPGQITRMEPGENSPTLLGHSTDESTLKSIYRDGGWNDLAVTARGTRLTHHLNGHLIVDVTDDDPARHHLRGTLALKVFLYYGPKVEARFRHLRLKHLEPLG